MPSLRIMARDWSWKGLDSRGHDSKPPYLIPNSITFPPLPHLPLPFSREHSHGDQEQRAELGPRLEDIYFFMSAGRSRLTDN